MNHDHTYSGNMHPPTALIQTQDASFVEPLREYLSRHGCVTSVNSQEIYGVTYLIITGDSEFVKGIIAREKTRGEKTLAIIYEGGENDVASYIAKNIHVAIIDPNPLNEDSLRALLLLLFTGSARSLISRKAHTFKRPQNIIPSPSRREPSKPVIESTSDQTRVSEIMRQVFSPILKKDLNTKTSVIRRTKKFILSILLVIFVFFLSYYASIMTAGAGLYVSSRLILSSKTQFAGRSLLVAESGIQAAAMFVRIMAPMSMFTVTEEMIADQERIIVLLTNLLFAEKSALSIVVSGKEVISGLLNPQEGSQSHIGLVDVIALRSEVVQLDQNLALVQAQLTTLIDTRHIPFNVPMVYGILKQSRERLEIMRVKLSYFNRLFTLYPQLAGYRKKQTYLVLLQNSMELRPTGGFIGSVALVTFIDGKVTTIEVQDVYTADGQLKGHVDPPLPIREILGQEHWYLRDSNWNPNFVESGMQAAWFYEKEMGVTVDGVIGISVPFITRLLEATGPLELTEYNDRISSTNFFAKSLLYTQADFFPGSTQKKDFLGSLTSALVSRITTDRSISVDKLITVISDALDAKDIQFYVPNKDVSLILENWGWSGGIGSTGCVQIEKDAPCTTEHIEVVEANLGVNKVNYFIEREAESEVSVSETGTITHALSYNIANNSSERMLEGGGVYRSYIRLYYPQLTNLSSIEVDGIAVSQKDINAKVPQLAPYYEVSLEGDKMVVGLYLVVDPLTAKRFTVKTTRLNALSFSHKGALTIVIGKQAGIEKISWRMTLHYPTSWTALSDGALANKGELLYNTTLRKNERMSILFEKIP